MESLETKDERQAKRKAALEIALHEALFGAARELLKDGAAGATITPEWAAQFSDEHRRWVLTIDDVQRSSGLGAARLLKAH